MDEPPELRVSLTPEGQRLAGVIAGEIGGVLAPMTGGLSAAEQKRLSVLLNKLV